MSMQIFYPASQEEGINILRARFRPDLLRHDANNRVKCYVQREVACAKASDDVTLPPGDRELFLVVVSFPYHILQQMEWNNMTGATEAAELFLVMPNGLTLLSKYARFALEIVPGTEAFAWPSGKPVPECGAGCGPW